MSTRLIHVVASGRISFLLWSSRSLLFRKHSLGTTQVPGLHHTSEMQRGVRQSPHSCGTYFAARKAESTDATVGRGRAAASVVACMSPVVHSTLWHPLAISARPDTYLPLCCSPSPYLSEPQRYHHKGRTCWFSKGRVGRIFGSQPPDGQAQPLAY